MKYVEQWRGGGVGSRVWMGGVGKGVGIRGVEG